MTIKTLSAASLAFVMALGLSACGDNGDDAPGSDQQQSQENAEMQQDGATTGTDSGMSQGSDDSMQNDQGMDTDSDSMTDGDMGSDDTMGSDESDATNSSNTMESMQEDDNSMGEQDDAVKSPEAKAGAGADSSATMSGAENAEQFNNSSENTQ